MLLPKEEISIEIASERNVPFYFIKKGMRDNN